MKTQYRIIFGLFVTTLFVTGVAFGAINLANNIADINETTENETNATEIANEAANFTPVVTTVATPLETTVLPTIPVSTPKSPGFGIVVTIMIVISAIYISRRRRI